MYTRSLMALQATTWGRFQGEIKKITEKSKKKSQRNPEKFTEKSQIKLKKIKKIHREIQKNYGEIQKKSLGNPNKFTEKLN